VNAAAQREDPDSVFTHYRRLIHLRAREDALVHGRFERVEAEQGVFAYTRTREAEAGGKAGAGREGGGGDEVLVALNLTADSRRFRPSDGSVGERLFGTHADSARGLRPWEANVWRSS
jgi:glycosidase